MKYLISSIALAVSVPGTSVAHAEDTKAPAAAKAKYTTTETELGVLLDDAAAKAILEKNIPGLTSNPQIEMARGMSLKTIQAYAPDDVTDARLAAIDAEFAKLTK